MGAATNDVTLILTSLLTARRVVDVAITAEMADRNNIAIKPLVVDVDDDDDGHRRRLLRRQSFMAARCDDGICVMNCK